jgi:hypothetical protein
MVLISRGQNEKASVIFNTCFVFDLRWASRRV